MKKLNERTIKKNKIYKGFVISLNVDDVTLPNNTVAKREYVTHPGGVAILAIKNDSIYLVKQFRYAFNSEIFEIPAGKLDKGEKPIDGAKREFSEEIGCEIKSIEYLGAIYPTVGYSNEVIHLFYTNDFVQTEQHLDKGEFLNVVQMPLNKFDLLIKNNEIKDAKTISAYFLWKNKKV